MLNIGSRVMVLKDTSYSKYTIKTGDVGTIVNVHKNVFEKPVYTITIEPYDTYFVILETSVMEV